MADVSNRWRRMAYDASLALSGIGLMTLGVTVLIAGGIALTASQPVDFGIAKTMGSVGGYAIASGAIVRLGLLIAGGER